MEKKQKQEECPAMKKQGTKTYNIYEVAEMTMLSDRTIRNYIRRGLLKGKLEGGAWCFTEEELSEFFTEDYVKQAAIGKAEGIVARFLEADRKNEDSLCTIYDMKVREAQEGKRLCEKLLLEINTEEDRQVTCSYRYDAKKETARIILSGDADNVLKLLEILKSNRQ
ncbi:helix-turn-helix domain-containing protein [Anaerocolumna sp. AGMB13020]|uniref:helix-turn-helix domain-containing protein n=1 Tax=Anaerocolumna sp. AGMB13020 TaxID=3081750 RepID=UPI002952A1BC|nr:helix-turn-helix domain-containing protein [Anaerocolumna sp. AGMB13020]WOO38675.1 helix-turn-helix domain-containing protein [Anaerocolumna sp. AGMB13020]